MAKRAKTTKRERGSYLTWVLVLVMAAAALRGMMVWPDWVPSDMGVKTGATDITYIDGILAGIALLAGYAAWYWKRWGLNLLYATAVVYGLAHVKYDGARPVVAVVMVAVACGVLWTATREAFGGSGEKHRRRRRQPEEQSCPECGATNTATALRCDCGYNFLRQRMERECPRCRRFVPEDARACPCGQRL